VTRRREKLSAGYLSLTGFDNININNNNINLPFSHIFFEKLGSTLRSFYQDKARQKTRKSEKTKTIFKKKVKKWKKKLPKKFKNIKVTKKN
jgi:choline-glycine betaine transporter